MFLPCRKLKPHLPFLGPGDHFAQAEGVYLCMDTETVSVELSPDLRLAARTGGFLGCCFGKSINLRLNRWAEDRKG